MPLVKIEILEGKTSSYKKSVLNGIHNAIKDSVGVNDNDIIQRIHEISEDSFIQPSDRSSDITIIEITLYPGRPEKTKKKLYEKIIENLGKNPQIKANDLIIVLYEPPMENWTFRYD